MGTLPRSPAERRLARISCSLYISLNSAAHPNIKTGILRKERLK